MKQAYKEILKAYTSLPHIILRKKYLIPQAPRPPKIKGKLSNMPPKEIILADYPHLVDENFLKLLQNNEYLKI